MTYFELLSIEKTYCERLTVEEKRVYTANATELRLIRSSSTIETASLPMFVDVALLLDELHKVHQQYNELLDAGYKLPNQTADQQTIFNTFFDTLQTYGATIVMSGKAAFFSLEYTEEIDALYIYLATVKMLRFDSLCDLYNVNDLYSTIIASNYR